MLNEILMYKALAKKLYVVIKFSCYYYYNFAAIYEFGEVRVWGEKSMLLMVYPAMFNEYSSMMKIISQSWLAWGKPFGQ